MAASTAAAASPVRLVAQAASHNASDHLRYPDGGLGDNEIVKERTNRFSRRGFAKAAGAGTLGALSAASSIGGAAEKTGDGTSVPTTADPARHRIRIPNSAADPRVRRFVAPQRILWQSEGDLAPKNSRELLALAAGEAALTGKPEVTMKPGSGILLDFGRELHGGVQICGGRTPGNKPVRVRVRFGESASEAMGRPNQDHAIHDSTVLVPFLGVTEVGNTGFRFVRIDVVDKEVTAIVQHVRAVFLYRDLEYRGSFECSDARLNEIWETGAYTVHLNMQEQLWDGIKRDRIAWIGDMHPEMAVINSVFGHVDLLPDTLDAVRDATPLPAFMNDMGSWSLWWVMIQRDWYRCHGDIGYLREQRDYLVELLDVFAGHIDGQHRQRLPGGFVDWPTRSDEDAVEAGVQAHMIQVFEAGAELCGILGEPEEKKKSLRVADRLRQYDFDRISRKSSVAFMVLAGVRDAREANRDVLAVRPLHDVSTFNGYYVLEARAKAADYEGCLNLIRDYWGRDDRPGRDHVLGELRHHVGGERRQDRPTGSRREERHPRRLRGLVLCRPAAQPVPRVGGRAYRVAHRARSGLPPAGARLQEASRRPPSGRSAESGGQVPDAARSGARLPLP